MSDFETKIYSALVVNLRREGLRQGKSGEWWDYSKQPEIMRIAEEAVRQAREVVDSQQNQEHRLKCTRCGNEYAPGVEPYWCPVMPGGQWAPGCNLVPIGG